MILPINTPAAAALALMIQKGGTIRLRSAELEPMSQFALVVEPAPKNPHVLHFKTATQDEVREILLAQVAEAAKEVKAEVIAVRAKEDAGQQDGE